MFQMFAHERRRIYRKIGRRLNGNAGDCARKGLGRPDEWSAERGANVKKRLDWPLLRRKLKVGSTKLWASKYTEAKEQNQKRIRHESNKKRQ